MSENDIDVQAFERTFGEKRVIGKLPPAFSVVHSRDYAAIRALAIHPRIFPHISDDFTSDPKQWQPNRSEWAIYLLANDVDGVFGLGVFLPHTHAQFGAHMAFLPRSWGNLAQSSFKQMLTWMWQNTTARRLIGEIERSNTLALRFARRAGFEIYGINRRSKLKGGVLVDQVCLGISKPE